MRLHLGDLVLDARQHELVSPKGAAVLAPKPLQVLLYLIEHRERVVPRDEMARAVWGPDGTSEEAFASVLRDLRRSLGDDARAPRFVRTLRGRGYRFVAPVARLD